MKKRYTLLSANLILLYFIFLFCDIAKGDIVHSIDDMDNWFLEDIAADDGWHYLMNNGADFSKEIIVAVIDTGCDYTHPLLQNALWVNSAEQNGIDGIDDDKNGYVDDIYGIDLYHNDSDPMDDSVSSIKGHGTHVAGTILQTCDVTRTDNPFNIKLMIIKAGDSYGNFSSENVAKALYYAADNGASVINMSLSSVKFPSYLQEALDYAAKSAIIVSSAGNKGYPTSDSGFPSSADYYPAAYPSVIGVMAHDADHRLSSFSNWNFKKYSDAEYNISAPGDNIYSCYYDSMYKNMKGTSMAAGIVSGCAALLCVKNNQLPNPFSISELTAHIMSSGIKDISHRDIYGNSYTFNRINLHRLLSDIVRPKLILKNLSIADGNILTYSIFNCGANANEVSITLNSTNSDFYSEKINVIKALDYYTGSYILPADAGSQEVTVTLHITYHNVSDKNTYSFDVSETFSPNPAEAADTNIPLQGITISPASIVLKSGETRQLQLSYIPENTTSDKSVIFSSSNPDIASVDKHGLITAISGGNTCITVISSHGHKRTVHVTVYSGPPVNINTHSVHLSSSSYNWNGKRHRPSVIIPGLIKGTDYLVSYSTKNSINIGRYFVIINGIGKYTGELSMSYDIKGYKGRTYTINGLKYQIVSSTSSNVKNTGKVTLTGAVSRKITSLYIPDLIKIGRKKYKVVSVKAHAFKSYTGLSRVTLGKNITSIGTYAFCGDRRLHTLKGKSINTIRIGKNAFRKTAIQW